MNDRLLRLLPFVVILLLATAAHAQWRRVTTLPTNFRNEVFFLDNNRGWVTQSGDTVLRTTDAGASWLSSRLPGATGSANREVYFRSSSLGFVSGDDGVWKSVDGGASWSNISPAGISSTGGSSSWFIDASVGVYGFGSCNDSIVTFCSTTDGGSTWSFWRDTLTLDVAVGGMTYNNGVFYAAGSSGKFWVSLDSGDSWSYSQTGSGGWQEDLIYSNGTHFIASANGNACASSGGGKVLRSTNGGANWLSANFPSTVMWGVSMYSTTEGWSCGDGGKAFFTTDGGVTWNQRSCGIDSTALVDDIHFTDATHGWAVGTGVYQYVGDGFLTTADTINFGDILVGTSSADSLAGIFARGSAGSVGPGGRAITGPDAGQFAASVPFTQSLAIPSCGIGATPVHFSPTSEGWKYGYLDVTVTGRPTPYRFVLKGRGVKPRLSADADLPFNSLACSSTGIDTLEVVNFGTYNLIIRDTLFRSVTGGEFRLISPSLPITVRPGGSVRLVLRATTSGYRPASAIMQLINNDSDRPTYEVRLTAARTDVTTSITNDTLLILPSIPINSPVTSGCLTLRNDGSVPQTIESVTAVAGSAGIAQAPTIANIGVNIGGTQTICFTATASDTGWHARRFRIRLVPCQRDTFVTVMFYATNPIITSPATRALQPLLCGPERLDTLLLRNTGNAALIVDEPIVAGADAGELTVVSPTVWPALVAVGGTQRVIVSFQPSSRSGAHTATLTFPNNDRYPGKSPWSITFTLARESNAVDVDRRLVDIGEVCVGDAYRVVVPVRGAGTVAGAVSSLRLDDSNVVSIARDPSGRMLSPGALDSIVAAVIPQKVGSFSTRVVVASGSCDDLDTVTIVGTAVGIDLVSDRASIDMGSLPIGSTSEAKVTVVNNGTARATITNLLLRPAIPGATITPAPPFDLAVGESKELTISFVPDREGALVADLLALAPGACGDTLVVPLTADAIRGNILANRTSISLGSILSCDATGGIDSVVVTNSGTKPVTVRALRMASGSASPFTVTGSAPTTLPPSGNLSVRLALATTTPGVYVDTLLADLDDPDQPLLRVVVTARRDMVDLVARQLDGSALSTIDFGSLASCDPNGEYELRLVNSGTVADTVTISSSGAPFSVASPSRIVIPPGRDTIVRVAVAMTGVGTSDGTFTIQSSPCAIERTIPAHAEMTELATTLAGGDFKTVNVGRSVSLSTTLDNPSASDVTIERVYVDPPTAGFVVDVDLSGTVVPAGQSLQVPMTFTPASVGVASAKLVAVTREPCVDTMQADLSGTGVQSNYYIGLRGLSFGSRLSCEDSCAYVPIEAIGTVPVQISLRIEGGDGAYSLTNSTTSFTLLPGSADTAIICFSPSKSSAGASARLVVETDDVAQPVVSVDITGNRTQGLAAPGDVAFGLRNDGLDHDTTILVENKSDRPITLTADPVAGAFELLTGLPLTIPPHGSVSLRLRYHASAGHAIDALRLRSILPCDDTLVVRLTAGAQQFVLTADAGTTVGRWGERVMLPIGFGNASGAPIDEMVLTVTAHPRLLEPVSVRLAGLAKASSGVERLSYDRTTGELRVRVANADGISSSDTLFFVEYEVLRGDQITTAVEVGAADLPVNVTAVGSAGRFTLADYCDAYGRLLETTGALKLAQNTPNPAKDLTEIEIDIPFAGSVQLSIVDVLGNEVARPIDEVLPAGRRRVALDVGSLASGSYSYRLTVGLQVLIRSMVVAR